ncbi:insulinase family protein [Clostridium sp. MSJ-11]|uniref:Insulinase family protein n=1 Tax=Clostridium mobile TaxID=2841512 RepID=A0ABS6EHK1_9CLOT|nr:insulinase family protein [Clostridium mobile]MBU5483879.1 insulinase family protein [Clostridium mobile]
MNFQIGDIYSGFKLVDKKTVEEVNSLALIFQHEATGAKLLKLENEDDNKVFSISFRTPPHDSTGVAHILEHSVLCGSRKFPSKEPFVELIKGSLNTFLNAMTFADKTMYPVASKNKKDFFNLMDVYLDAVLYPNIYKYPQIFMQEGWHHDLESPEGEITYKGVVYNEMKGAFSSPESILMRKIPESLFPDTTYGVESGGDPDHIPELTYENFINFHKKYYHPSNSYTFLYGDGDTLEELSFIHDNYLKDFKKIDVNSSIAIQKSFGNMVENVVEYPISQNEGEEDKTFLSLNFVVGKATDEELYLAFEILEHLLLETSAAPLKKALIQSGIGKDVFGSFDNSVLQPTLSIIVKNSNEQKKDEFKNLVFTTLKELVDKGIDKKLIQSSLNIKEFYLREADYGGYPKGLIYGIKCMDSWLYDHHPLMHLSYEPQLKKIKERAEKGYFEELINEYLLKSDHSSLLIVKPKKGLAEEKDRNTKEELKAYKEGLSKDELKEILDETEELVKRQNTPDSQENIEKIPLLSIEDISRETEKLPIEVLDEGGIKVLKHDIFTNKIAYVDLYFNTENVPQELIPYIGLLSGVLGKVSTEKHDYEDLSKEVNINTGGIYYSATAYSNSVNVDEFTPMLKVKSKALVSKLGDLFKLLLEEIRSSKFDDSRRIKEILSELKSRMEMTIFDRGHMIAVGRVASYYSAVGAYLERVSGINLYHFVVDLEENFESKKTEIESNLNKLCKLIFNKENVTISVTLEEEDYKEFKKELPILVKGFGDNAFEKASYNFDLKPENEGLMTSGKVQYNAKGYNFKKLGYKYTGTMQVLKTIVSFDYLWNKVRVQGGAYGCFGGFNRNGNMYFVSYRDPHLKNTLNVYDKTFEYIENFTEDERGMTKYIIGTVSDVDSPLTPSMKGDKASANYFSGVKYEDIQREREEILDTKVNDIKKLAPIAKDCMKEQYICVLGNEDRIKEEKDMFNNLIHIFK